MEKEENLELEEDAASVETEFEEDEISLLNQFMKTVEDSFVRLKKAYEKNDIATFNRLKVVLVQAQRRISEVIE